MEYCEEYNTLLSRALAFYLIIPVRKIWQERRRHERKWLRTGLTVHKESYMEYCEEYNTLLSRALAFYLIIPVRKILIFILIMYLCINCSMIHFICCILSRARNVNPLIIYYLLTFIIIMYLCIICSTIHFICFKFSRASNVFSLIIFCGFYYYLLCIFIQLVFA